MVVSSGFDYEVFLSFRGPDTRAGITNFLYNNLTDAGIRAYIDDEELRVGEEIGPELLQAIEQSRISIPIFSKRYASSKWCLKELVQMKECKKTMRQKIMPIFYDVEPSEVRYQTGGYGQAFLEHESKGRYNEETIREWKAALSEVGAIKGWDLQSMPNRREGDFVKTVVKNVFNELKKGILELPECLVEVNNHVSEIMRMIGPQTHETRIVGIHGIGGVGKTTLAKIIYNQLLPDFEHHCFLSNIRETSKVNGVEYLQNQLISDILKRERQDISIRNTDEGIQISKARLHGKRLLLLLDDVDRRNQLNALIGERNWFGEGSKLIITSRNKKVLNVPQVFWTYELKCMDYDKSLQLFSKYAPRMDRPLDDYLTHSKKAVGIARGLPLALEVIGSLLHGKKKETWDDILEMLENVPDDNVINKLKISYEALDDRQKHIFLDIACFFIGYDKETVIRMWDETKFFPKEALKALQDMSLIKINENKKLWMHDLLRDMGREIIRRDSNMVTEKQTRVWYADQALEVLMTNQEKEKVEALHLQSCYQAGFRFADEDLMRLPNLRMLVVDGGPIGKRLKYCSSLYSFSRIMFATEILTLWENFHPIYIFRKKSHLLPKLQWLTWENIPLDCDIAKLSMKNLVVLNLAWSTFTHRWHGWSHIKMAKSLKVLDLSGCWHLVKTPDFSGFAKLERLIMRDCISLVSIDKSIGQLQRLVFLDISFCPLLGDLPNEIQERKSSKALHIEQSKVQDDMSPSLSYGQQLQLLL